jgi:hypothetical protein
VKPLGASHSDCFGPGGLSVETITVMASRSSGFALSDMEMLVGSALVIALIAWTVLSRMRHPRSRH